LYALATIHKIKLTIVTFDNMHSLTMLPSLRSEAHGLESRGRRISKVKKGLVFFIRISTVVYMYQ